MRFWTPKMTMTVLTVGAATWLATKSAEAAEKKVKLTLVKPGQAPAAIVISREPTNAAVFAAVELQEHIRKITGVEPPIVPDDRPSHVQAVPATPPVILVGASDRTRELGLTNDSFKPQEYLIRFAPGTLVLMGRDKQDAFSVTVTGQPQWVPGKFGQAISFAGKSDAVTIANPGFADAAGTFEAWVQFAAEPNDSGTIFRLDGTNPWSYHILQRAGKRVSYVTYDGKAGSTVTGKAELADGWHHVLATWDAKANKKELFVDGVSQGTATYSPTACAGKPLQIGGVPSGAKVGNPFCGQIDQARLSNTVQTPAADWATKPGEADAATTMLLRFDEGKGLPARQGGSYDRSSPPDHYDEQGTCYAVYDFLERFCGVRWYGPTELETVFDPQPTLTVTGTEIRRTPAFEFRNHAHSVYTFNKLVGGLWNNPKRDDMVLFIHRMRLGGKSYLTNHSFYGYYDRFWKKNPKNPDVFEAEHPEYFAKGYDGQPPQLCYTHPALIAQVVKDAREFFDGKGSKFGSCNGSGAFGLESMDNSQYCKCDACRAEFNKAEEANLQFSNGQWSDYLFGFANKVALEVKKTHPDRLVTILAYSSHARYPSKLRLEPNIMIHPCLHTRNWWCPAMERSDLAVYKPWVEKEKTRPVTLWLYHCFPEENASVAGFHCFPGFQARQLAKQMQMFAADGVRGIFTCGLAEQVDFYLFSKMLDDPTLDAEKTLDEFFRRYYGAAAKPMQKLYDTIEETFCNPKNYSQEVQTSEKTSHQTEEMAWGYLGTPERMATMGKLMAAAKAKAETASEKQRVALFENAIWNYMVEGQKRFARKAPYVKEVDALKQKPLPVATIAKIAPGPAGDPAKVDWSKCEALSITRTLQGYPAERTITARVLHDGTHLYLRLEDPVDPARLVNDGGIWMGDDWEIFFAAQRAKPYRQFYFNPAGKFMENATEPGHWVSNAKLVSKPADGKWLVLLSLPLADVVAGGLKPGGKLYLNLVRGGGAGTESLAWSPHFEAGRHKPERLAECTLEP